MSDTTVNGPAPTGDLANAVSPIFWYAVGEAIQFGKELIIWLMNAPFGTSWWTTIVYGPVACIAVGVGGDVGIFGLVRGMSQNGALPDFTPCGPRSRSQSASTAWALNGVPSENVTPWRRLIVTSFTSALYE